MNAVAVQPADPKTLRSLLHADIDRLPDDQPELARQLLLEMELKRLIARLDDTADRAREMGKLTPESISAAVAAHRAARPYR